MDTGSPSHTLCRGKASWYSGHLGRPSVWAAAWGEAATGREEPELVWAWGEPAWGPRLPGHFSGFTP